MLRQGLPPGLPSIGSNGTGNSLVIPTNHELLSWTQKPYCLSYDGSY